MNVLEVVAGRTLESEAAGGCFAERRQCVRMNVSDKIISGHIDYSAGIWEIVLLAD